MKLNALRVQFDSLKTKEVEIEVDLDCIVSYLFTGSKYYVEVIGSYGDREVVEITQTSFIRLVEVMEDYHNPNKFGDSNG